MVPTKTEVEGVGDFVPVAPSDFLADLWPPGAAGQPALFVMPGGGTPRHVWPDESRPAIALAERFAGANGVYFTPGHYANRDRRQPVSFGSVWVDIDAGAEKHERDPSGTYVDAKAAVAALVEFARVSSMPPSYVVASGEGVHAYWLLAEPLAPDEWRPVALGLKALCKTHGLRIDPTCTGDTARVMRLPGSTHKNGKEVRAWRID